MEGAVVYYRVRTIGQETGGPYSNEALVGIPVEAPSSLGASYDTGARGVQLTWKDESPHETGYDVYRKKQGGRFELVASLPADTASYLDKDPATGAYAYRVLALGVGTSSPSASEVAVEVP